MLYRIARDGQTFGPYNEAEVEQYRRSGHIVDTDLAQAEGAPAWLPVGELFPRGGGVPPMAPGVPYAPAASRLFPDPPDLPWWVALLLGLVTGGIFFVVWDLVEAAWLRRLERSSMALVLYLLSALIYLFKLPSTWRSIQYNLFNGPPVGTGIAGLGLIGFGVAIAARFVFRRELLLHFNGPEPLGLRLNGFWTLLFGGLYFQYHFNKINAIKRSLHISVPTL